MDLSARVFKMGHHFHFLKSPALEFVINKKESFKAKERYDLIKRILVREKDVQLLKLLDDLLEYCIKYVEIVVNFSENIKLIRRRYYDTDIETYKREIENLDKNRTIAHNALISALFSFNRNITENYGWMKDGGEIPIGGIYSLTPETIHDRKQVAVWSWYLISGLFVELTVK